MKSLYVLPVFAVLPMGAFAESDFSHIKPFVGYNLSLASSTNVKIKQNDQERVKTESLSLNDNNVGDFILGVEIDDVMAVSINPSVNTVKTKVNGGGTTTEKMNSIEAEFDIYLTRNSDFKPFVSLGAGYASMDGTYKASGAMFSLGLGCRQYINNNVYLGANISYNVSTEMDIKEVNGVSVSDVDMRVSGFDLTIGAGYRF